ncbi:MAG: glycosyl hydrolase family 8, partial [Paludibacteraceae bacterium]|nr:glycosyl hydrolase family 8 [Paludibacteraceae bacterium]
MMKHFKNSLITGGLIAVGVLASVTKVMAQDGSEPYDPSKFIKIEINSGDPTYPYPQFLEYTGGGKTLAKYNAEGVTHADMEKAGRESYEIMMHRCRYMGGTHCGVKYITFNHESVPGNYGTFVSEGDGYALLAAAIFGDQKTFNGLYMWVHDHRFSGVERFQDGKMLRANEKDFAGPYLAGWQCDETTTSMSPCHSATDGDVDIAMAMLIAYKQWGEYMKQDGEVVKDYAGKPISLKYEAQRVIGALVDTLAQWDSGSGQISGYINGVIGIDGYEKRGNSWGELTSWRKTPAGEAAYPGMNGPYGGGPNLYGIYGGNYIDYDAPAYFEEFWRWLKNGDGVDKNNEKRADWEIHQFKRAAASGNWLNKKAYEQGLYASIGLVTMETDGEPSFGVYVDGEDFRYPWRHMMDYLWHGNADYDWDPKTHQVIAGTNTSERDMGIRHAELLRAPLDGPGGDPICKPMGASPDPGQPYWFGVSQIPQQWRPDGGMTSAYHTNYSPGAGSPAAVISEDLELLADIYRQCEIMWDGNNTAAKLDPEERYIGSTPKYFHGWFRTLGMLVCSGNLASPEDMKPIANAKVYMSVDKTYAYQGDNVTYGVQFRNYGTLDADGVTITTKLDPNYDFVSATKNGKYNAANHSITWNIGSIPGFKTGKLDATMDSVFFTVNVRDTLNKRICLTSTISGSNFPDWVSNEYPNHATYTMERNCVDILSSRSLYVKKTANRNALNPKDVVTFTTKFGNKSEGEDSWMNGGRDHVRISYGTYTPNPCYQFYSLYRFWNDSYESYINMGNYRVSYFMYDAAATGLVSEKNPTGWTFVVDNQNDLDKYGYNPETGPITFAYQKIPQGSDEHGKWNQRLMIRFADVLMAPSTHVYDKLDSQYLLHKGVWGPGFIRARLASNPASDLSTRVTDDWSFDPSVGEKSLDGQGTTFTLISPCWANYDNPGYEIDNYSRHVCKPAKVGNYGRILVEEFDGYTWRRIQGTGPLPGKEAYNVTICDTIPYELEWVGWVDSTALKDNSGAKIQAKYTPAANPKADGYTGIIKWTIPEMLVGEEDKLVYKCKARDLGCPDVEDTYYKNVAWIWSDTDSPDSSQVDLMTSCSELPPVIEPQTSLFKSADREMAETGDVVNYKVKFVNTEGTRVESDCKSTEGMQKLGSGSLPAVGEGGLKLSTNGSTAYFFGPEKSYGSNGAVYATFGGNPSSTQALYIVFRYNGGTPGKADFKGVCMQMMINKDGAHNFGYYLYNDGDLIASEGLTWADAMQFPGDDKNPTFKFVLNDDHLYMYVNDQEDEWTNVSKDWEGLTSKAPGFFGMYVNSNGNSGTVLSSFVTELDYAFDIKLSDKLPAELGNVTDITGKGEWDKAKNEINWPVECTTPKTALAPGDSIVRTFAAEVVSCEKYINNLGIATVYGMDSLKVLNTIECGAQKCNLTKVTLKSDDKVFCETDS